MRTVSLTAGLLILLAGGVVHGIWTDRWQPSTALAEASPRLNRLPDQVGSWTSQPYTMDPEALTLTGAANHYSRMFVDPVTGDKVLVILLVGKATQMVVHRPEHCYQAAGWQMTAVADRVTLRGEGDESGEFLSGLFTREEISGSSQMRIYWSWLTPSGWTAPTNPRWTLAREKVLFKLYVLRDISGPHVSVTEDPCARLIGLLLPAFRRTLHEL